MSKKKKKLKKRNTSNLIYVMMALFLAVYIPSIYNIVCGKSINVGFISLGEIEESVNATAYIIRNENIVSAPFTGRYVSSVEEGDKLYNGQKIATVLRDGDKEIIEKIKELDFQILEAKRKKATNQEIFGEDISKIDKQIEKKVKTLSESTSDSRYERHKSIKHDIDVLIQKKNEIIGKNVANDPYIETKINERKALNERLNKNEREVYAKTAGLISFSVDGFENVLKESSIDKLNCKFFENMKNVKKDSDNLFIKANLPFAKIISGIDAYIVVPLDEKDARGYDCEKDIKIRFNDINKVVPAKIVKRINDDKILVISKIDKALQYLTSYRVCNVDLIKNSYDGYKVSRKSLKNYNELTKVAQIGIVKFNKVKYNDVKVLGCNEEFAIIENDPLNLDKNINLYDRFVLEPENIVEGQIMNGV